MSSLGLGAALALAITRSAHAQEGAPSVLPLLPPDVQAQVSRSQHWPLAQRMKAVTEPLLGTPYVSDPLGEGTGRDPQGPVRYDAFDCLTFVEEALALSLSSDPEDAGRIRRDLRYSGDRLTYAERNHFMELQWIPDNIAAGYLRDATGDYGETLHFKNTITSGTWAAWSRRSLFLLTDDELPTGPMSLMVWPLQDAIEHFSEIQPGSVVLTVREHRPWIPIWITHLGFVVDGERPTLRHATRMKRTMRVTDTSLEWYLKHLQTYKNWPVAGISILEPIPFGPRITQ